MKKYRILYWFGSCYTDWYVLAENEETAKDKFRETKGNVDRIIRIEETGE